MPIPIAPIAHLQRARLLISGGAVSLEHILAADTGASLRVRLEQQAAFIIGELEHAVAQMKRAVSASEAEQAIARCEATEVAELGRAA